MSATIDPKALRQMVEALRPMYQKLVLSGISALDADLDLLTDGLSKTITAAESVLRR